MKKTTLARSQRKFLVSHRTLGSLGLLGPVLFLFACGGSPQTTSAGVAATSMSGTATYGGAMNDATVKALAISNGAVGAQLGSSTTDAQGSFTVPMGDYSGAVMLQVSGGTYADDATGATMTMQPADVMTTVVPSIAPGSVTTGVQVTPLTSMAQARAQNMAGGMTDSNIAAANAAMASYFSVSDILRTPPMNPQTPGSASGAGQDAKNYGMSIAAMSEYAASLGMPHSSGMVTAMMDDASDGTLDGMMRGTPVSMNGMGGMAGGGMLQPTAGSSGLATAMTQFMSSTMNRSGVTASDMQALLTQLAASSGRMPNMEGGASGGMVSGTVVYGPMNGGSIAAFAVTGAMMGAQLGSAAVESGGHFTMSIGNYSGPMMLRMTGGTYVDDATGTTMTMRPGDAMTTALPTVAAGSTTSGVQVTPLTAMAQARAQNMAGGMTDANIASANDAVGNYFSIPDILHTSPMNPQMAGSAAAATQDSKNYGMSIAAMSEYAKTVGMTASSGIITAMMDDATDDLMNGMMGSTAISMNGPGGMGGGGMMGGGSMMQANAGTSGMAAAMTAFLGDTAVNKSGVTAADVQALIAKLRASTGALR